MTLPAVANSPLGKLPNINFLNVRRFLYITTPYQIVRESASFNCIWMSLVFCTWRIGVTLRWPSWKRIGPGRCESSMAFCLIYWGRGTFFWFQCGIDRMASKGYSFRFNGQVILRSIVGSWVLVPSLGLYLGSSNSRWAQINEWRMKYVWSPTIRKNSHYDYHRSFPKNQVKFMSAMVYFLRNPNYAAWGFSTAERLISGFWSRFDFFSSIRNCSGRYWNHQDNSVARWT